MVNVDAVVDQTIAKLVARDPDQPEFKQAVEEVRAICERRGEQCDPCVRGLA